MIKLNFLDTQHQYCNLKISKKKKKRDLLKSKETDCCVVICSKDLPYNPHLDHKQVQLLPFGSPASTGVSATTGAGWREREKNNHFKNEPFEP